MANLTIRDLPDAAKNSLRIKAATAGLSLEAYVRHILQEASNADTLTQPNITDLAHQYFGTKNGVELELPSRSSKRGAVDFDA